MLTVAGAKIAIVYFKNNGISTDAYKSLKDLVYDTVIHSSAWTESGFGETKHLAKLVELRDAIDKVIQNIRAEEEENA